MENRWSGNILHRLFHNLTAQLSVTIIPEVSVFAAPPAVWGAARSSSSHVAEASQCHSSWLDGSPQYVTSQDKVSRAVPSRLCCSNGTSGCDMVCVLRLSSRKSFHKFFKSLFRLRVWSGCEFTWHYACVKIPWRTSESRVVMGRPH